MSIVAANQALTSDVAVHARLPQTTLDYCGVYTIDEWWELRELQGQRRPRRSWFNSILGYVFLLPAALYCTFGYFVAGPNGVYMPLIAVLFIWGMTLLATVGMPCFNWLAHREIQAKYDRREYPFGYSEGEVSVNGITERTSNGEEQWSWAAFCGYRATPRVLLLKFSGENRHVLFAQSVFASEDDWKKLHELVASRLCSF